MQAVWREYRGCLEGMVRLSGEGGEAVWRVWGGCLEGIGRLSESLLTPSRQPVYRMMGGYLEG